MKKILILFILYFILISFSKQDEEVSNLLQLNNDYQNFSPIVKNKPFSFQLNLLDIKDEQEVVITLNSNYLNKKIDLGCSFSKTRISNSEELNICDYKIYPINYENFYHLVLKKKTNNDYFSVSIKLKEDIDNPFLNVTFTNVIPIELKYSKVSNNQFPIRPFYPIFRKYIITKQNDWGLNYIFVTSSSYMNIFDGDLLTSSNDLNNKIYQRKISVVTLNKNEKEEKIITLRFITDSYKESNIKFSIKNIDNLVKFIDNDDKPNLATYSIENINPFEFYYFINQDLESTVNLIYFEKVLGDLDIYYINRIDDSRNEFLPSEYYGYKITDYYILSYTDMDIFSIKCKKLCTFNIHFVSDKIFNIDFNISRTNYFEVTKSNERRFSFSVEKPNNYALTICTSVPKNLEILFKENLIGTLNINDGCFYYEPNENGEFLLRTDSEPVLVIVRVNEKIKEKIIENYKGSFLNEGNKLIFKIKNMEDIDYFILKTENNPILYHFGYGKDNQYFHPDTLLKDSIQFYNPFRHSIIRQYDNLTYFYFYIHSLKSSNIKFEGKKKSTDIKYFRINRNRPVLEETTLSILQNRDIFNEYLVIIINKCGNREVDFYIKFNETDLKREFLEKPYNLLVYPDTQMQYNISIEKAYQKDNFEGVIFYYTYADKEEIDNFKIIENFYLKYNISSRILKNNSQLITLEWPSPFNKKIEKLIGAPEMSYRIYIIPKDNDKDQIKNICSSNLFKKNYYSIITKNWTVNFNVTLDRNIEYVITITGRPNEKFRQLKPVFYWPQITIPRLFFRRSRIWIVFLVIAIILLIVAGVFIYMYSKMKITNVKLNQDGYSFTHLATGPLY